MLYFRLSFALLLLATGCSGRAEPADRLPESGAARVAALGGPAEFAPVFTRLDSALPVDERVTLRRTLPDSSARYHMSIGLWLRNEVLRVDEPLMRYMMTQGIHQRDDMSGALLQGYGAHLRGERMSMDSVRAPRALLCDLLAA